MLFSSHIFLIDKPYRIMKFNDKNNAVHLLMGDSFGKAGISKDSSGLNEALYFCNKEFPHLKPLFRKSIQYLCRPFFEAYQNAKEKLLHVVGKEPLRRCGTFIYPTFNEETLTTFYDLKTEHNGQEIIANGVVAIFANIPNNSLPQLIFYCRITDNNTITSAPYRMLEDGFTADATINDTLALILFLKYCPLETKTIAKGKKVSHSNEEYLNKTQLPIEILDSTWFTTIVRSEGFTVGGHFRMQPIGPGGLERKLIWINSYEKKGYVRKAGVLRAGENSDEQTGS